MKAAWIALTMMVACGAWGQSQPPTPNAPKVSEPQQPHAAQSNDEGRSDKNPAAIPPISIIVSPTISADPRGADQRKNSDNQSPPKDWIEIIGSAITVLATIVIAVFTRRLSDSTNKLWEETRKTGETATNAAEAASALATAAQDQSRMMEAQRELMQSSLAATEKAANAAELSAKAAMGVARGNLILSHLDFDDMGAASLDAKLQSPKMAVQFVNYGQTFAIPKVQSLEIICTDVLPKDATYDNIVRLPFAGLIVDNNQGYELAHTKRKILSADEIKAIKSEEQFLWVYGFILYDDFLGQHHERRFCKRLYIIGDGYAFAEDPNTPKEYTESS